MPHHILNSLWILALGLSGCSGTTHRTLATDSDDRRSTGLRYYDSSPYLFVHTDNQGGLTSEFVYLPDTGKKRSAKPFAFLSKNKTTLTWTDDGAVLTGSSADLDSSDVPKTVVASLQKVAETAITKSRLAARATEADPPAKEMPARAPAAYLFKIVKQGGQWGLVGTSTDAPSYRGN